MPRKFWWWTVSVLTVAILVAAAVITTIVGLNYRDTKLTEDAREAALKAGTYTATVMLGFDPGNIDQQVTQARQLVTGAAEKEYEEIVGDADFVASVKEQQVKSQVTVQEAGVVTSTRDTARILIFVNQSVTKGGTEQVNIMASRLEYSMERSGDKWLVTNIDIITDDSVKAQLATEADKAGASTVPAPAPTSAVPESGTPAPETTQAPSSAAPPSP